MLKEIEITTTTQVYGLKVRTNNANELNSKTAQIGSMWGEFYDEIAVNLNKSSKVFGVYCNYESDAFGDFDVFACSDQELVGQASTLLEEGHYLVFRGFGEMPATVIETWKDIWNYFSSSECQHQRAYRTDYEVYENEKEVSVYIGIE